MVFQAIDGNDVVEMRFDYDKYTWDECMDKFHKFLKAGGYSITEKQFKQAKEEIVEEEQNLDYYIDNGGFR